MSYDFDKQKQNVHPETEFNSKTKEEYINISPQNAQQDQEGSSIYILKTHPFDFPDKNIEQSSIKKEQFPSEEIFLSKASSVVSENEPNSSKKEGPSIIQQVQKEWIIKTAELDRIGGTYDFFTHHLEKYKKHLNSRKTVILNINTAFDSYRIKKSLPIMLLKEYFKDYSELCSQFHQKTYKFQYPQRVQSQNKIINTRVQLKLGYEKLFSLRKQSGNEMNRLEKYMKSNTSPNLQKHLDIFWNNLGVHRSKMAARKEAFQQKQKKFYKRIDKIGKVYTKGRLGEELNEDVFQEMIKFVKEERQLRNCIFNWSKQILALRKAYMQADTSYFNELSLQLDQYKNFNNSIYQLKKKKSNFLDQLRLNISGLYEYSTLCTPTDNDYILSVINYKTKKSLAHLKEEDYESFFNEEYFHQIIGQTTEFLKGTIVKSFPLKNPDEELLKTVSGNLIHFNKKSLQTKYKMRIENTELTFKGHGGVGLKQTIKGIIFDSTKEEIQFFKDNNRAEQLILYLGGQLTNIIQ